MDNSLFSKYQKVIQADGDKKEVILNLIESVSGLKLNKEDLVIKKKEITLMVSSAKKSKIHQSKVKAFLSENGYTLNY